jgi:HD-like signal output (HDOD) protein
MSTAIPTDTQILVEQAVKKISSIATLPEVTARIIETVENPHSSAGQLHKIVAHDPALVSRILKVVNSAFYGLPGQIASVERAIVLLGINAVKNIAVAASLGQMFRGGKICQGYSAKDLWTHCVAVGVTARALAKEMRWPVAEEAFLAGMIHDLGLLVSLQTAPDALRQVCDRVRDSNESFCAVEDEISGVDHQHLGAGLTALWRFPRSCQLVAGYHHRPMALAQEHRPLVTLVYVADTICCQAGHGFCLTAANQSLTDAELEQVQIDPAIIERVQAGLGELVSGTAGLFG